MSQHTPAPWQYEGNDQIVLTKNPGGHVKRWLLVSGFDRGFVALCPADLQGYSDARLIAAAPELLEVLNEVCHTYTDLPAWLSAKLASVLAKAEGRDPVSLQEEIDRS